MKRIQGNQDHRLLVEAARQFKKAKKSVALTGAGISVASGIPDFRSEGGLWTVFSPEEYATLGVFLTNPTKAWELYRALGKVLIDKYPNAAHHDLAHLESQGLLEGIVTQNVDNLHQQAGSLNVHEIHGDHQHLQCVQCGHLESVKQEHYLTPNVPCCPQCTFPLKPNVVLFGEAVRSLDEIDELLVGCDLLMVLGTSTQVYPAAGFPDMVKRNGGLIYEFNLDAVPIDDGFLQRRSRTDYYFMGDVTETLPQFVRAVDNL